MRQMRSDCLKCLPTYSRCDVDEVQQLNQIQSLQSLPKIGVPHLSQKRRTRASSP